MNINEIAQMAGVSRATVSRFLNDGYVSKEKRERIAEIIEKTGYVPSAQAQTLRTGRTNFIGVIVPRTSSEAVSRMVGGMSEVFAQTGYRMLLADTDNDYTSEVEYLRTLTSTQVDGIILVATVITAAHRKAIAELGVPLVMLGQRSQSVDCVYFDDSGSVSALCEHVLATSKHPAYIGVTPRDLAAGKARTKAFLSAAEKHGIAHPDKLVYTGDFSVESGRVQCEAILADHPETDAVICATDNIAVGAMQVLLEHGKRIPEDVQVTGVGDSAVAALVTPKLTSAHYHYRTSGTRAASLLLDKIDQQEEGGPQRIRMEYLLVPRESTR